MQEFSGLIFFCLVKANAMLRLPLLEAKHLVEFTGILQMIDFAVNLVTTENN